LRPLRGQLAQR